MVPAFSQTEYLPSSKPTPGSLSPMLTVAVVRDPRTAPPVGLLRVTRKVLVGSLMPSLRIGTVTTLTFSPGAKNSVSLIPT